MEHCRITIAPSKTGFMRDGKPFFLLSDTNWMAFQKLPEAEWEQVVRKRREQGFNALQISVLPILHDNSTDERGIDPFFKNEDGYDFTSINEAYFNRAENMLAIMCKYGLTPFLHLFWVDYVDPEAAAWTNSKIIPYDQLGPLAEYMIKRFKKYAPIYSASGDTKLQSEQVEAHYLHVLDSLLQLDPQGLTTLHLFPGADPSDRLCRHPQYHFYAYQSGHHISTKENEGQQAMLAYSKQFLNKKIKKPIVNTEPCYEGHGFGDMYGRFSARDVRHAAWQSILSGASAGVSYGAHGVWQFYMAGAQFNNAKYSSMPYPWYDALNFAGAWDVGYLKYLYEQYNMGQLAPCSGYAARSDKICMAANSSQIAVYLPYNDDITIKRDLSGYTIFAIALESRRILQVEAQVVNGETKIARTSQNEDILLIAYKK